MQTKTAVSKLLRPHVEFQRIYVQDSEAAKAKQLKKFFVVFENKEQMEAAMEAEIPNNPKLPDKNGKLIPAKWTSFTSAISDRCVCIKGLTKNISEKDLRKKFKTYGKILNIDLISKKQNRDIKFPFAFIFFEQIESASKAVETAKIRINSINVDVQAFKANEQSNKMSEKKSKPVTIDECSRTLHISNATSVVTTKDIHKLMSRYGKVNRVWHQIDESEHILYRVVFENEEGYNTALKVKDLSIKNNPLTQSALKWRSLPELYSHMAKVDGLPKHVQKGNVRKMFKRVGSIVNIELMKPLRRSTAVAYVFFKSPQAARRAVSLLDGIEFEEQTVSVYQKHSVPKNCQNTVFIKKSKDGVLDKNVVEYAVAKKFGPITMFHEGLKNFVVTFENKCDAEKALKEKKVKVSAVFLDIISYQEKSVNSLGVLVTGLAKGTELNDVVAHFQNCGNIVKKYMGTSKRSSGARSIYAYLEFGSQKEKTKAMKLTKTKLNGKVIFVRNSKPRFAS